jgi:malic enzyme
MAKAREVTDRMFTAAAVALAGGVGEAELARGQLYPPMASLRETSATVRAPSFGGLQRARVLAVIAAPC